jgi:hypothetical protein
MANSMKVQDSFNTEGIGIVANNPTAACAMDRTESLYHLRVVASTAVELPSVTYASGRFYSIVYDTTNTDDVTISCTGSDKIITTTFAAAYGGAAISSFILDAQYEYALLFCDGVYWYNLSSYPATLEEPVA